MPILPMAMLQQTFKIEEENRKNSILEIISDKYCRGILNAVMDKPKSVMEITVETKIPVSNVYRRVRIFMHNMMMSNPQHMNQMMSPMMNTMMNDPQLQQQMVNHMMQHQGMINFMGNNTQWQNMMGRHMMMP